MSKHDPSITSASPRHDGWSLAKQAAFLRQLSASHSVSAAAKSVGMSRQSAYRLRSKLKGQAFDLAWEVAFHHSYDVLAHAALDRALNGVEVPVYYKGEKVDSYRKYDERLTVALLSRATPGGNPAFGRLGPQAERQARDFEGLLARIGQGEGALPGALTPEDAGEVEALFAVSPFTRALLPAEPVDDGDSPADPQCPSGLSDAELMAGLRDIEGREGE